MNGLLPIIRRVRRPLLPVEDAAPREKIQGSSTPTAVTTSAPTEAQQKKEKRGEATATEPAQ